MASSSSILPAAVQAAGVVWGCHILAGGLKAAAGTLADSPGSHGLAKLGAAAQAYKPAVAALGRSLQRGLLLSLFPVFGSAPRCKDCGERLAEKGANGRRSNTRASRCKKCAKRRAATAANISS